MSESPVHLFAALADFKPPERQPREPQRVLPAEPEILLPSEMPAGTEVQLFDTADVEQALKIFDTACGQSDRRAAVLAVMMFALRVAAINLDVHP